MLDSYSDDEIKQLEKNSLDFKSQVDDGTITLEDETINFYETRKKIPDTEKFRAKFIDDYKAINPMEESQKVLMDVEIETTINRKCEKEKKEKTEKLSRIALVDYF